MSSSALCKTAKERGREWIRLPSHDRFTFLPKTFFIFLFYSQIWQIYFFAKNVFYFSVLLTNMRVSKKWYQVTKSVRECVGEWVVGRRRREEWREVKSGEEWRRKKRRWERKRMHWIGSDQIVFFFPLPLLSLLFTSVFTPTSPLSLLPSLLLHVSSFFSPSLLLFSSSSHSPPSSPLFSSPLFSPPSQSCTERRCTSSFIFSLPFCCGVNSRMWFSTRRAQELASTCSSSSWIRLISQHPLSTGGKPPYPLILSFQQVHPRTALGVLGNDLQPSTMSSSPAQPHSVKSRALWGQAVFVDKTVRFTQSNLFLLYYFY